MYTATLYYDTGFDPQNIPRYPNMLTGGVSLPVVDYLQKKFLSSITLKVTGSNTRYLERADYIKITGLSEGDSDAGHTPDMYYFIQGYEKKASDVVVFSLLQDFITSAGGIDNLILLEGIITRKSKADNGMPSFLDDELLGCAYPLEAKLTIPKMWGDNPQWYTFCETTIDLTGSTAYQVSSDPNTGLSQMTVYFPPVDNPIEYRMQDPFSNTTPKAHKVLSNPTGADVVTPGTSLSNTINLNIAKARRLGQEGGILRQWRVPVPAVTYSTVEDTMTGLANDASDIEIIPQDFDPAQEYINVLMGDINEVTIYGSSGDQIIFKPEEIWNHFNAPTNNRYAGMVYTVDPRPDGCAYFRPKYFRGIVDSQLTANNPFFKAVKGANWPSAPITYTDISGVDIQKQIFAYSQRTIDKQRHWQQQRLSLQSAGARLGEAYGFIGGTIDATGQAIGLGAGLLGLNNIASDLPISGFGAGAVLGSDIAGARGARVGGLAAGGMQGTGIVTNYAQRLSNNALNTELANLAESEAANLYYQKKLTDLYNFGVQTSVVTPQVVFQDSTNAFRDWVECGYMAFKLYPSTADRARLTKIIKMFGEKVFIPLDKTDAGQLVENNGYYFSYLEMRGVKAIMKRRDGSVSGIRDITLAEREGIAAQLSAGIRIWKNANPKTYENGYTDYLNLQAAT